MAGEVHVTGATSDGGFDVLQLRSNEVSRGFSGAPVWDERGTVAGMVMSVARPDALGRQGEVSFIRPIEQLVEICDELRPPLEQPYRGLEVFDEQHAGDYFGRERAGRQLLDMLVGHDFVGGQATIELAHEALRPSSCARSGATAGCARSRWHLARSSCWPWSRRCSPSARPARPATRRGSARRGCSPPSRRRSPTATPACRCC